VTHITSLDAFWTAFGSNRFGCLVGCQEEAITTFEGEVEAERSPKLEGPGDRCVILGLEIEMTMPDLDAIRRVLCPKTPQNTHKEDDLD
jgi:hypothetical protein